MRRYLVAGNWKMNTTLESGRDLARAVAAASPRNDSVDVLICPPFVYLMPVIGCLDGSGVTIGAQNCYHEPPGAFTGETGIDMLLDADCSYVILGHSERRHVFGETDELINKKVAAALGKKLAVILCIGELLEEREAGRTEQVLDRQMSGGLAGVSLPAGAELVLAYEPVWAIGTGKTATPEQAQAAHAYLRQWLRSRYNDAVAESTRILYGGSVKPDNARALLSQPDLDGALVGGASLKPESFVPIIEAARALSSGG